ncbi:MAG: matrixin family metalloprotease [Rubrivivax sp.]
MSTLDDVRAQPRSGLLHIDALLSDGPLWNLLLPNRNTLRYTFGTEAAHQGDAGTIFTGTRAVFNSAQQQAVVQALGRVTQLTGIRFEMTTDAGTADLHFSSANLVGASTTGYTSTEWVWETNGQNTLTRFNADAWVYLDNTEWSAQNANPARGSAGYQTLLHEIGHALGLKHPFEGDVTLPAAQDNTANTLMSYTGVGDPHNDFSPYDQAALGFLFGGDGIGGALGWGSAGWLLTGTPGDDSMAGGSGNDKLKGSEGQDTLRGGAGIDTAVYAQASDRYTVTLLPGSVQVSGPEGTDTLTEIERLQFSDQFVTLGSLVTGTSGADRLSGTEGADEIQGLEGDDRLSGAGGNDRIDGGPGIDVATFTRSRTEYLTQRAADGSLVVQAQTSADGRDTLLQVERLAFIDQSVAWDLDGNAGTTARYLGAVFGRESVSNKAYAGIGLKFLDGGTTPAALMQLALDARLGAGFTNEALVDLLYTNLVGQAPPPADRAFWVGTLAAGTYTPVSLAQMAAALDLNADNIGLAGLQTFGLGYTPAS